MKKTLLKIIIASLGIAIPFSIASCDGSDGSTNTTTANESGDDSAENDDDEPNTNADCFEGQTYRFVGTQSTTTETTTPVASSTTSDTSYDLTVEFLSGGQSRIIGVVDVTNISTTVAGFTTNVTAGLGPVDIDQTGTYTCDENSQNNTENEVTVIDGDITTTYKLTFTSSTSGTFENYCYRNSGWRYY